jgi:hypothetical protein
MQMAKYASLFYILRLVSSAAAVAGATRAPARGVMDRTKLRFISGIFGDCLALKRLNFSPYLSVIRVMDMAVAVTPGLADWLSESVW